MYIKGFGEAVESEIDERLEDATKYNGGIFALTRREGDMKYGNHGDIIKYIDEEVKTLKDMKEVMKALLLGLTKEI